MTKGSVEHAETAPTGLQSPRSRHGRHRSLVVTHWPMIHERRRLGFQLVDIWHEITNSAEGAAITYRSFLNHVRDVTEALASNSDTLGNRVTEDAPRGARVVEVSEPVVEPPLSQKALFRLAREAREREAAKTSQSPATKPDTSMIDGGEIWMGALGRQRVRELAVLNLKLRSGEIAEEEVRPILEAARREAWSKRLGIRADQLTEEDMNGCW